MSSNRVTVRDAIDDSDSEFDTETENETARPAASAPVPAPATVPAPAFVPSGTVSGAVSGPPSTAAAVAAVAGVGALREEVTEEMNQPIANVVASRRGEVNGEAVIRMLNDQFRYLSLDRQIRSFRTLETCDVAALYICEIVETFCQKYAIQMPPLDASHAAGIGFQAVPVSSSVVSVARVQRVLSALQRLMGIDLTAYGLDAHLLLAGDGPQIAHVVLLIDVLFRTLAARPAGTAAATAAAAASVSPAKKRVSVADGVADEPAAGQSSAAKRKHSKEERAEITARTGIENSAVVRDMAYLQRKQNERSEASAAAEAAAADEKVASVSERRAERLTAELSAAHDQRVSASERLRELQARALMNDEERAAYDRAMHKQARIERRENERKQQQIEYDKQSAAEAEAAADRKHTSRHNSKSQSQSPLSEVPILRKTQHELDALKSIAATAERRALAHTRGAGAVRTSSLLHHSNELLAASRRREDKKIFQNLQRIMNPTAQKRLAVDREKSKLELERDLIGRDVRRQAWLENATAQGVSFATSARSARVAAASAAVNESTASTASANASSASVRSKFAPTSPFAKPAKRRPASAGKAGSGVTSGGGGGGGGSGGNRLAEADARYFGANRSQHANREAAAQALVWDEIAHFEHKLKSQIETLNQFFKSQISTLKSESVSVRARKKAQAEAVRELQRDIRSHQTKIAALLKHELDHRDEHYRYTLEQQIPRSDGGAEWSRPPDAYVSYSWN